MNFPKRRDAQLNLFREWELANRQGRAVDATAALETIRELRKPSHDYHAGGYKAYSKPDREMIEIARPAPTREEIEADRRRGMAENPRWELFWLQIEARRRAASARDAQARRTLQTMGWGEPERPRTIFDAITAALAS